MKILNSIEKQKSSEFQRIYRGAYTYAKDDSIYAQESFEVFKEKKDSNYHFDAQILGRAYSGELLKINIFYITEQHGLPSFVHIEKTLGDNILEETYEIIERSNMLEYHFKTKTEEHTLEITTPPKFHITTPSAALSMAFLNLKKVDQTSRNYYYAYQSPNQWEFQGEIKNKNLVLLRANLGETDEIKINNQRLQATQYKLFLDQEESKVSNKNKNATAQADQTITVFVSKHLNIPYKINAPDGSSTEIVYLNHFEDEEHTNNTFTKIE